MINSPIFYKYIILYKFIKTNFYDIYKILLTLIKIKNKPKFTMCFLVFTHSAL